MIPQSILSDLEKRFDYNIKIKRMSQNTAKAYLNAAKKLFKGISDKGPYFVELQDIRREDIEQYLAKIRTKTKFSMYKNALKELKSIHKDLDIPEDEYFKKESLLRMNRRKKAPDPIEESKIKRKINALKDKKLKLAYRVALANGLRISEVANLKKEDVKFEDGKLNISVKGGKGNKDRNVLGLQDEYLERELKEHILNLKDGEKLFYSAKHMKNKAGELEFECHDLRRIFAQNLYQEEKKNVHHPGEAKQKVKEKLGHSRLKTTKIYLSRKIIK